MDKIRVGNMLGDFQVKDAHIIERPCNTGVRPSPSRIVATADHRCARHWKMKLRLRLEWKRRDGETRKRNGEGREGRGKEGLKLERSKEGFQFRFAFARHTRRRNNKEAAEKELRKMRACDHATHATPCDSRPRQ